MLDYYFKGKTETITKDKFNSVRLLRSEVIRRMVEEIRLLYYRIEPYLIDNDLRNKEQTSYKKLLDEMETMRQLSVAVLNVPIIINGKGIHISTTQFENKDDRFLYSGYTNLTAEWINPYEKHSNY